MYMSINSLTWINISKLHDYSLFLHYRKKLFNHRNTKINVFNYWKKYISIKDHCACYLTLIVFSNNNYSIRFWNIIIILLLSDISFPIKHLCCPWGTHLCRKRKINCASFCQCISFDIVVSRKTYTSCYFGLYFVVLIIIITGLLLGT